MTVADALRAATAQVGTDWGRDDVEVLMAHALGTTRSAMLLRHMRDAVPPAFAGLLARWVAHEPVAYIVGAAEFYGRTFRVTPDVLIPRGDSEAVVAAALDAAATPGRVLDLGTGSGCLLLTVLAERAASSGTGMDRSPTALAVARGNAAALAVEGRAQFLQADWTVPGWSRALSTFDLILANPPYVEDAAPLDRSVSDFEPASALFAGADGLDAYRAIIPDLPALLEPGGVAVLEIGYTQAAQITALAQDAGFEVALRHDLAGRDRALILRINRLAKPA